MIVEIYLQNQFKSIRVQLQLTSVVYFTSISRRSTISFFVAEEVMDVIGRSTYFQAGFFAFLASGGFGVPSYKDYR